MESSISMSPAQTYKVFRKSLLQDTDEWREMFAEGITIHAPLARLKGIEACIAVHESFYETVERCVVTELVEHEDLVITQVSITIENKYKQSVLLDMNEWYTIRNEKIEDLVIYFDASVLNSPDKERYDEFIEY
jgi:hypothetical protein